MRLYHALAGGWIVCAMVIACSSVLVQACGGSSAGRKGVVPRVDMWTKPRSDLRVGAAREHALIAHYAELNGDDTRAAREIQQAWCLDRDSSWLSHKRSEYQRRGLLDTDARCYVRPLFGG